MQERTYTRNGSEFIVEELTRKEFVQTTQWAVEDAAWAQKAGRDPDPDTSIWVEYKDGSTFSWNDMCGAEGKWRKTNIVFGVLGNAATWQVFGDYEVDENGIVQRSMA